jgi:hypothetical protein
MKRGTIKNRQKIAPPKNKTKQLEITKKIHQVLKSMPICLIYLLGIFFKTKTRLKKAEKLNIVYRFSISSWK